MKSICLLALVVFLCLLFLNACSSSPSNDENNHSTTPKASDDDDNIENEDGDDFIGDGIKIFEPKTNFPL